MNMLSLVHICGRNVLDDVIYGWPEADEAKQVCLFHLLHVLISPLLEKKKNDV